MPTPISRDSRPLGWLCSGDLMPAFTTTRRVPFTPRQMFDLVADVENYPKFFPMCEALRVTSRQQNGGLGTVVAEMDVGYGAISETITSRATLDPAKLAVAAELIKGPFNKLENCWRFTKAPGGCDIHFAIDYEFSSFMLQLLVGAVFDQALRRCTEAFETRAREVYGPPAA